MSLKSKESVGYDGLSTKLLKNLMPTIIKPITFILNQSLGTGLFPNILKPAKVVPFF